MIRLFATHQVRSIEEWDGLWDFEPMAEASALPPHFRYRLTVPGCWEMHPDLSSYRGYGAFRRQFSIAECQNLQWTFQGVSHTAVVYLDGVLLARHYNAYTAFSVVAPQVSPGDHELVVLVDNGFHEGSTLHVPNDYYTYGGLIRPVSCAVVPDMYLESLEFTPRWEAGAWVGEISVSLRRLSSGIRSLLLTGRLQNQRFTIVREDVADDRDVHRYTQTISFPGVRAWSPTDPALYLLTVELTLDGADDPIDDLIERVGFRTVSLAEERVRINGDAVMLQGFNRHEDYPVMGAAIPLALMAHDLDLLSDMGANAIRTSHYPNDERFLDLCDERGFLVWEEHHARGFDLSAMQNPRFQEQISACTDEMVAQHRNHPAIIMWGVFNECASDSLEGKALYAQQIQRIRGKDGSRPITYASHHRERDLGLDLVDIVAFNLYPRWYTDEVPEELFAQTRAWADDLGGRGKPVILSETGADGFYGFREMRAPTGSEELQAQIIEEEILAAFRLNLAGIFIWQFADCRVTEDRAWRQRRAMSQNSKGVVDRYRRPKLAYAVVRKLFRERAGGSRMALDALPIETTASENTRQK